jgi:protein AATF/BFR2
MLEVVFNIVYSKSKLRQPEVGGQYVGSRISRTALFKDDDDQDIPEPDDEDEGDQEGLDPSTQFAELEDADLVADDGDEDIDSDAAFGESDVEKFKNFTFQGSSRPAGSGLRNRPTASDFISDSESQEDAVDHEGSKGGETDEDILDTNVQHLEERGGGSETSRSEDEGSVSSEASESDDESESGGDNGDNEKARRAELRKIMNEEQTTVIAAISQAAKDDADKGNAVIEQRKTFDSLLNVRIALQKALIATNSLGATQENHSEVSLNEPYQAAEDAALKLWNTLDRIRHEFIQACGTSTAGQKRKRDIDKSTSSSTIWGRMQDSEVASMDNRRRILEKWWGKVKGSTPSGGKLIIAVPQQNITSAIQEQLSKPGLLENTKRPRSCAPIQERQKIADDPQIYDDTSFYKLLLNQLVEQRKMDSGPTSRGASGTISQWAIREAKMRKNVDTKASKGRKLRYTVHEKLQNFMAPEATGGWEQEAIDRFFGTLLGQTMTLKEDGMEVDEKDDISPEEAGLKLFRS